MRGGLCYNRMKEPQPSFKAPIIQQGTVGFNGLLFIFSGILNSELPKRRHRFSEGFLRWLPSLLILVGCLLFRLNSGFRDCIPKP